MGSINERKLLKSRDTATDSVAEPSNFWLESERSNLLCRLRGNDCHTVGKQILEIYCNGHFC